jgi:hypothetical protein
MMLERRRKGLLKNQQGLNQINLDGDDREDHRRKPTCVPPADSIGLLAVSTQWKSRELVDNASLLEVITNKL